MIVREVLLSDPRVLAADSPAREVAELLLRPNVKSVLVVDGETLVGCVTVEAIVRAVASGVDVRTVAARELSETDVTTIPPEASLDEALRLMTEHGLERLPVTEDGRLVGVLAREPILRRLAEDEAPSEDDEPLGYR
jgi:CBS domain-containing protein